MYEHVTRSMSNKGVARKKLRRPKLTTVAIKCVNDNLCQCVYGLYADVFVVFFFFLAFCCEVGSVETDMHN